MIWWFSSVPGDLMLSDPEQDEALQELHLQERQMRRDGTLADSAVSLQGAQASHELKLHGYMSQVGEKWVQQQEEFTERRLQLQAEGRSGEETEEMLRHELELAGKGETFVTQGRETSDLRDSTWIAW